MNFEPNEHGYWGEYGGRFVPETLMPALDELTVAYYEAMADPYAFVIGPTRSNVYKYGQS